QVLADAGTAARAEPIRSEPAQAETTTRVEPIRPVEPSPAAPVPSEPAMISPVVSEAVATEPTATAVADPATPTPEPEPVLTVAEALSTPPEALEPDVLPNVLTRTRAVPAEQPAPSPQTTASDEAATAGDAHP
ncbi:DUF4407 domain-containing protein, partial [Rhodopseudomonas sp. BR0G17]|nr:DUF4407 domain-containing protein [Rhodopseudomonas sp. BR0G17]